MAIVIRHAGVRRVLLAAGLTFHAIIAIDMGLMSFFLAMAGALLLYLLPVGHRVSWPGRLRDRTLTWWESRRIRYQA